MIFALWGEDKTCKTTLALTFPKPLVHFEFDIGGFERAAWRFKEDIASEQIICKQYPLPLPASFTSKGELTLRQSKIVIGMKELWHKFLEDYYNVLQEKGIATVVIDTGTVMWEVIRFGFLQEKQEQQKAENKPIWEQLVQLMYGEPNARMRAVLYAAKGDKEHPSKHLVMTHHSRDEFKQQLSIEGRLESVATGFRQRSGWGSLGDIADIIAHTYIVDKTIPYCTVELCGLDLRLQGAEIQEPSYDGIMKRLRMLRGEEVNND